MARMTEPTAQELEIYRRVKDYLEDAAVMRRYGYLLPGDSIYAQGAAEVVIGGKGGPLDDYAARYEEGYYQAATELVDWAADRIEAAWTVYPILFVSRHALELSLKKLIIEVFRPVPETVADEHNIKVLWDMLLQRLEQQYRYAVPRNATLITKVMAQLTEIDPQSMNSRYATKKDFHTVSIANPRLLSLRNLQAIIAKLYNELYNIFYTIEQQRQYGEEDYG
jgi:hypothetical protein